MYRVGVDLGGTNIVAGVINEEMKIIGRGKLKTNCPRAAEAILEDVAKAVEAAVIDAGITMNVYTHASYDRAEASLQKILQFQPESLERKSG